MCRRCAASDRGAAGDAGAGDRTQGPAGRAYRRHRRHAWLDLPEPGHVATTADKAALWLQPGCWLIEAPAEQRSELPGTLAQALKGIAAVVDQSHGRCVIEISGTEARAVLARLCRLDLHERVFAPGHNAATLVGHVSCLIHRLDGTTPSFRLLVGSTFAEWLLDEITAAAASQGWRFTPAGEVVA